MIVSEASRMFSAISFGVFCRSGDRGPVAAGFADHRGGLAGDGRLVHRGDALDHVPVAGDDLAGLDHHVVAEG